MAVNEFRGLRRDLEFDYTQCDHLKLYDALVKSFGAQHVLFLPVEMLQSDSDDFFSRLNQFMGMAIEARPIDLTLRNSSKEVHIVIQRQINRYLLRLGKIRGVSFRLGQYGGTVFFL